MHRILLACVHSLLLILLLVLGSGPSRAQLYPIENLEEANGLPSPLIKDITQDRRGLVWVATRGGLAHFDGVAWRTPQLDSLVHDNSHALLALDPQGDVWALFSGHAPSLLNHRDSGWTPVAMPEALGKGAHLFSHFVIGQDGKRSVPIMCQVPCTLWQQDRHGWRQMELTTAGVSTVTDMVALGGVIHLATPEGLFKLKASPGAHLESVATPDLPGPVLCMSPGVDPGTLWLVGADWIGLSIHGRIEILHQSQDGLYGAFVEAPRMICHPDAYGGLYLAGGTITQYFHPDRGLENMGPRNGLLDNAVITLFRDRENVMWLGTANGITKLLNRHVRSYSGGQGLLEDEVTALLRRRDGTIIIGHPTGLTIWNGAMQTLPFRNPDLRDRVLDLAEDDAGNVWIAGRNRGLGRLSPDGELRWWSPAPDFPDYFVSVMSDLEDRIWVAASDRLLVMDGDRLRTHHLPPEWQDAAYLRRLIMGPSGRVYIATGNIGVLAFEEGGLRQWNTGVRDHGNSVYDVFEAPDGRIWAGTRAGLYLMQNSHLVRPEEGRYRIESPVYFIEQDIQDRLWVGTDNGVLRVDGTGARHFTVETGLIGRETNRCASLVDDRGRVWVGTERGLNIFDPRFEGADPIAPLVSLLQLEAGDHTLPLGRAADRIQLPRAVDNLVIRFRAITTTESHRLRVRTRLEGLDQDWVETQNPDNRIRYANLGPGTYRFHIQAAGFGQPWSEVVSSPLIHVPTPLLQSPWIILLGVLIVLILILLPLYSLYQRRYTTRLQAEVARQVEDIRRIEQELEQTRNLRSLGVLAGGIAHDFNNLLTIIFGNISLLERTASLPPKQQDNLRAATGAIERARGLTNQLLTFSRGGAPVLQVGSLTELVQECTAFFSSGSNLKCRLDLPADLPPVAMDPGQMSQVFHNLLRNAQEAMPDGGAIDIRGQVLAEGPEGLGGGRFVSIELTDEGPGIPAGIQDRIFEPYFTTKEKGTGLGLATAFSILDKHGGRLSVDSPAGEGARFQVLLPVQEGQALPATEAPPAARDIPGGEILVLDDDPEVRQILLQMIARLGLQADGAADGPTALGMYRRRLEMSEPYLAVLVDVSLPGGESGPEVLEKLRGIHPAARAVVMSGYAQDPVMAAPRQHGFLGALAKPPSPEDLEAILRHILADANNGP